MPLHRLALASTLALTAALGAGCATTPKAPVQEIVWPLPPDPPKVRWVRSLVSEQDLGGGTGRAFRRFLVPERPEDRIDSPTGLALSPDGKRLYVACGPRARVLELDLAEAQLRKVADAEGFRPGMPFDVAVDADDHLYVSDSAKGLVWVYDRQGAFLRHVGKGVLERPTGLALDRKRRVLYVVEGGEAKGQNHQVEAFALDGTHLRTIGSRGGAPGQFNFPARAAVDADGNLFVADTLNFRVQVFDPTGVLITTFGGQGSAPGQFLKVKGLAFDSFGNLHAVDSEQSLVQILNSRRQPLMAYGGRGYRPELMLVPSPIVIDDQNNIFVADYAASRVNQYQLFNVTKEESLGEPPPQAKLP